MLWILFQFHATIQFYYSFSQSLPFIMYNSLTVIIFSMESQMALYFFKISTHLCISLEMFWLQFAFAWVFRFYQFLCIFPWIIAVLPTYKQRFSTYTQYDTKKNHGYIGLSNSIVQLSATTCLRKQQHISHWYVSIGCQIFFYE